MGPEIRGSRESAPTPRAAALTERPTSGWRTDGRLRRTRTPILDQGEPEAKRAEILRYFHDTWDLDEALLETLRYDESFRLRADPLRHPLIFYYGHTAVFYVNKLVVAKLLDRRVHPAFESMFAVGVDEMSWDDLNEAHYDWPTPAAVQAYRDKVRALVDGLIRRLPLALPITWQSPWWAVLMGIEHARIHLETSSVLIRQLPLEHVRRHPLWEPCTRAGEPPENELIEAPGGSIRLGKPRAHRVYGWDNEYGERIESVAPFRAARHLVTNAGFRAFVDAGGYAEEHWWTGEGWRWRSFQQAAFPRFWRREEDRYRLRLVTHEIDMPWDWPVEVNYLEAKAFCNWLAGRRGEPVRLPTEAEWQLLRERHVPDDQPDWEEAPGNLNLEHHASSCPVGTFTQGPFSDLVGNVWQWTETPITGFPGFEVHPYYDDFSTPTFDGRHNLIKGGSWISTGNEATRHARYAFRRHFYQHAGFRYLVSAQPAPAAVETYESDPLVAQYCESHYGEGAFGVPNFPAAMAGISLAAAEGKPRRTALDIGCSVGRAAFELARGFESVTGLDFSARFIRIGAAMQEQGFIQYTRVEEGEIESHHEARLAEFGLEALRDRVRFEQADACNLKERYTGYDLVLAANLIDRLPDPARFLETIAGRILPGGLLVIASPYSWDEAFTPKSHWLGGRRVAGEPLTTLEALHRVLEPAFRPVGDPVTVPFVIRETRRKFQHSLSQVTVWERKL